MSASDRHEDFPWHLGVFDAHCHPTDTMESVASIPNMKTKVLTVMATRSEDQELVSNVADDVGLRGDQDPISRQWKDASKMVPCFGWHPWFTHQMFDETEYEGVTTLDQSQKVAYYQSVLVPKPEDKEFLCSLPEPRPFSQFLAQTRQYLQRHQLALVGEVGLDKGFRIPIPGPPQNREDGSGYISQTPGARDGRPLSPYRVSMEHQRKLLKAQFRLAGELHRAVSVHGVQAHGVLLTTLQETWKGYEKKVFSKRDIKKQKEAEQMGAEDAEQDKDSGASGPQPFPPRICLHSYSGPPDQIKQYLHPSVPAEIFFSFSYLVNFSNSSSKAEEVIRELPADKILVESDYPMAGEKIDGYLEDMVRLVCKIKKWRLEEGVIQLGSNWKRFCFGSRDVDDSGKRS